MAQKKSKPARPRKAVGYRLSADVEMAMEEEVKRRKALGDRKIKLGASVEEALWAWIRGGNLYVSQNRRYHDILEKLLQSTETGLREFISGALELLATCHSVHGTEKKSK